MYSCNSKCCHELWLGLIAFVVGAVFLLQKFDIVPETTWGWLWPSILVVMGLKLMLAGCCSSCDTACKTDCCMPCDEKPKAMKKAPAKRKKKATKKKKK